jgi:hypothetical protein
MPASRSLTRTRPGISSSAGDVSTSTRRGFLRTTWRDTSGWRLEAVHGHGVLADHPGAIAWGQAPDAVPRCFEHLSIRASDQTYRPVRSIHHRPRSEPVENSRDVGFEIFRPPATPIGLGDHASHPRVIAALGVPEMLMGVDGHRRDYRAVPPRASLRDESARRVRSSRRSRSANSRVPVQLRWSFIAARAWTGSCARIAS